MYGAALVILCNIMVDKPEGLSHVNITSPKAERERGAQPPAITHAFPPRTECFPSLNIYCPFLVQQVSQSLSQVSKPPPHHSQNSIPPTHSNPSLSLLPIMLLSNSNNGDEEPHPINGISTDTHRHSEDIDSSCSTPYVSAPSSPGRGGGAGSSGGYFFSAPASPMHFVFCKTQSSTESKTLGATEKLTSAGSFEFEFSSRFSPNGPAANGSMSSADELFFNGQIRPMKLSSHLQRPQILAPLIDLDGEDEEDEEGINRRCHPDYDERVVRGRDLRSKNRSLHRKARSMSPLRVGE